MQFSRRSETEKSPLPHTNEVYKYSGFSLLILPPACCKVHKWYWLKLRQSCSVWSSLLHTYPQSLSYTTCDSPGGTVLLLTWYTGELSPVIQSPGRDGTLSKCGFCKNIHLSIYYNLRRKLTNSENVDIP